MKLQLVQLMFEIMTIEETARTLPRWSENLSCAKYEISEAREMIYSIIGGESV